MAGFANGLPKICLTASGPTLARIRRVNERPVSKADQRAANVGYVRERGDANALCIGQLTQSHGLETGRQKSAQIQQLAAYDIARLCADVLGSAATLANDAPARLQSLQREL